jgi:hypothetical protein
MDKNNIQFRYLMNLWKSLSDYPTKMDVIYELSVYLMKDGRPNGEFSHQTFNSAFGSEWESSKHSEIIGELIKTGEFEETSKSVAGKKWYKIKNNPYYKK